MKDVPIAFNYAAATAKEFEGEYDFKRPPKKEEERKKTLVLVADSYKNNDEHKEDRKDHHSSYLRVLLFNKIKLFTITFHYFIIYNLHEIKILI